MEALRRLERVQSMLAFIDSHGLSASVSSDRFLAHLLLFFVQPCDMLSLHNKFSLAFHLLSKVTSQVVEDLKFFPNDEIDQGEVNVQSDTLSKANKDDGVYLQGPKFSEMPLVGLDSMQRANSTLEDFCRSYFMFHDMDANRPESIFKFLPILSFTESYIYQLDTWNEKNLCKRSKSAASSRGIPDHDYTAEKIVKISPPEVFDSDLFKPLISLLQDQGMMTGRINDELISGIQYWSLETMLCQALIRKEKILVEDVLRAIHLKSFDYRVLNLLLYQLRGQEVNELHMEFLSVSEFLVEVSDDLYDYEDDVTNNTFNILRMFVAVYGASLAPKKLIKCISDAEKRYEALSRKLEPNLSLNYWKRCEEATKEGGVSKSGNAYGMWSIPPLILDEDAFRAQNT
ncbi:ATP synthase subunit B [Rhynchospora pubera]|uniref:ATP synthase subunit B n=1 Tax=Rhynchospora pubera TaxID=906938 RepID=A0AAV8CEI9_9POAL|nr:ATP synthase subunit B [Rhynchospora pubera]KAJ4794123.1 ATP synthase subunit B [Rhynchospora pubera]